MDRLARNLDDLRRLVRTLTGKGVRVEFVKESLVFTGEDSPMATLLLSVMGAFAEFERALILERQREGIAAAKQRGVYTGRKPALTPDQARDLAERAAAGARKSDLAREFGISRETVYSYLRATPAAAVCRRRARAGRSVGVVTAGGAEEVGRDSAADAGGTVHSPSKGNQPLMEGSSAQ
ncbi:Resolvase helix-turn-helix domain protein [Parafrankia sp. EUN1f]|nr:Resolvase helix-turn-helix domain protein [Parafrankia sp. EUN1f]